MQWIYLFKHEQRARFSENQSTPKLENRKTTPCSPRAPNLLHMLPSRMAGLKELCNPGLGWSRCWGWARAAEQPTTGGGVAQVECLHSCSNRRSRCRGLYWHWFTPSIQIWRWPILNNIVLVSTASLMKTWWIWVNTFIKGANDQIWGQIVISSELELILFCLWLVR